MYLIKSKVIRKISVAILLLSFAFLFAYGFGAVWLGSEVVKVPLQILQSQDLPQGKTAATNISADRYTIQPAEFRAANTDEDLMLYLKVYGIKKFKRQLGEMRVETKKRNSIYDVDVKVSSRTQDILILKEERLRPFYTESVPVFFEVEEGLGRHEKIFLLGKIKPQDTSDYMISGEFSSRWDFSDPDVKLFLTVKTGGYEINPTVMYGLTAVLLLGVILSAVTNPHNKGKSLRFRGKRG